ncbi:hypothetical protein [Myceligenerans salitolerans]|uniref:Uncharacterized protein n=1 Tax=Myceligenerans salitolerans TaxID=1230528 RepID=A0ABS3I750_9MICO|nr:hypothetical protein [Myceligenerans salitolerans]MBO0608765.1 hypothetical protein [Myceligenerans salitolerans]
MSCRVPPGLPLLSVRRRPRPRDPEAGQGLTEYVGVVGVVLLVVIVVVGLATPVGADVGRQLVCAVQSIGDPDGHEECVDGAGDGEDDPGGDGPGSDDEGDGPDGPCEETITTDVVEIELDGEDEAKTPAVIQIDCVWYPVPESCVDDDVRDLFGDEETAYQREELEELAGCITRGWGDPSDDPDDESCNRTKPSSEDVSLDPPKVRIGCKWLPVPEDVCDAEWEAYTNAEPGRDRAGAAGILDKCVTEAYDNMEPDCYIQINTHMEEKSSQFLFFRFSSSEGVMIEELGDGRVRVHMLTGDSLGFGASADEIFNSPISFGVSALEGDVQDTTYEFVNRQDAQDWIDWKEQESGMERKRDSACSTRMGAGCHQANEDYDEFIEDEPDHHIVTEADSETKKVTFNGGITLNGDNGNGPLSGGIEGGYEGEVMVEDRMWDNGLYEVSYTSTDIGGFLIGGALGGGKSFGKGNKSGGGSGGANAGAGGEWKGSTKTTVYFGNEDEDGDGLGDIVQMYITIDQQALQTLYQAGVDVEAELPYGFTVGGGGSHSEKEGNSTVQEFILDFNQYPELRETFAPMVDELFPRDETGELEKGDIEIHEKDSVDDDIENALADHGNVRELTYEDTKVEDFGEVNIGWQGIDLFSSEWITVDEERVLKESSFEITDVNGDRQVVKPAPRCKHEEFVPDDDYYTNGKQKTGAGGDEGNPVYDEDDGDGPYPGTDFDGDVPGERGDISKSLVTEYRKAFPDKNIIVYHRDIDLEFAPDVKGREYLAEVENFYVVALDSGKVTRKGDGGYINWSFDGNYSRPGDGNVVRFEPIHEEEDRDETFLDE